MPSTHVKNADPITYQATGLPMVKTATTVTEMATSQAYVADHKTAQQGAMPPQNIRS